MSLFCYIHKMNEDLTFMDNNSNSEKDSAKSIIRKILVEIADIIDSVLSTVFVVLIIFTFVLSIASVEGESMLETLHPNDRLIISQFFYTPKNGDIVIINSSDMGKKIVKRIIATQGQLLEIKDGMVYVDGVEIDEPYLSEYNAGKTTPMSRTVIDEGEKVTIPEGFVFVMGDNRGSSKDSRMIGMVKNDEVIGKVILRLYPLDSIGIVK